MRNRLAYHSHSDDGGEFIVPGCEDCREKFEVAESVCFHCWRPVSNRDFFKRGSRHQHNLLKDPLAMFKWELEHRRPFHPDWRWAAPGTSLAVSTHSDQSAGRDPAKIPEINSMRDLAKWWRVPLKRWK